jgi:hypothetical protein
MDSKNKKAKLQAESDLLAAENNSNSIQSIDINSTGNSTTTTQKSSAIVDFSTTEENGCSSTQPNEPSESNDRSKTTIQNSSFGGGLVVLVSPLHPKLQKLIDYYT